MSEQKIPVKIGVQTMMWGKRLTRDQLIRMLVDIAKTAKNVFPDIEEIGIEFGQKIHDLGYDFHVERRSGNIRREHDDRRVRHGEPQGDERRSGDRRSGDRRIGPAAPDEDVPWDSGIINYTQVDLFRDLFLGKGIEFEDETICFDGKERPSLVLLGFSGRGSLEKRIEFCKILNTRHGLTPKYFMFYQWYDDYKRLAEEAAKIIGTDNRGVPLAFHPFRFGPADKRRQIDKKLKDIDEKLPNHIPQVQFVPDTAHLWLANQRTLSSSDAIKWTFGMKMLSRITVFHLKDWKKTFDSSLRYYSRGFTALGGGYISSHADGRGLKEMNDDHQRNSDLGAFCRKFEINFGGVKINEKERWVVFEQDFTTDNEGRTLKQSLDWFKVLLGNGSGEDENTSEILPVSLQFDKNAPRVAKDNEKSQKFDARKRQIISELHCLASDKSEQFASLLQDLCRYLFYGDRKSEIDTADADVTDRPVHVALWELSPRISTMVLLNKSEQVGVLTANRSCKITNDACTGFRVWELLKLSDENEEHKAFFGAYNTTQKQLEEHWDNLSKEEKKTSYDTVIWIPICNTYNYNQIEARLDIFVDRSQFPVLQSGQKGTTFSVEQSGYQHKLEGYLDDLVQNIGSALEKMWGHVAYQRSIELIDKIKKMKEDQTSDAMLKKLIDELTTHFLMGQGGCFYYEWFEEKGTLQRHAPWSLDNTTDDFFECNNNDPGYQPTTDKDFWIGDEQGKSWMAFPIFAPTNQDTNKKTHSPEVFGIIRCYRTNSKSFTASDENTVREILADFVPLFLMRYISEHRMKSIRFIRHELKSPLGAITMAVDEIVEEVEKNRVIFSGNRNYSKEIGRYTDIMSSVLDNSVFLGKEITMNFDNEPIPLIKDIVMPAINQGLYIECAGEKDYKDGQEEKEAEMAAEIRRKIFVFCNGKKRNDVVNSPYDETGKLQWENILIHGPPRLYVDGARMLQVFFNLLVNAIKYRPQLSGGKIEIYLNSLPYRENSSFVNRAKMGPEGYVPIYDMSKWAVEILFCNEGVGIPNTCNELIFKEGFRASNVKSTPKKGGDGLGLWVVRKILKQHNESEISLVWNGGEFTQGYPTMFRILLAKSLTEPHR